MTATRGGKCCASHIDDNSLRTYNRPCTLYALKLHSHLDVNTLRIILAGSRYIYHIYVYSVNLRTVRLHMRIYIAHFYEYKIHSRYSWAYLAI